MAPQPNENNLRKAIESRPEDVKMGRGPSNYNHPGTARLRKLIKKLLVIYRRLPRGQRSDLATEVISCVHNRKGRFLSYSDETQTWYEVTDLDTLNKKILHRFHDEINKLGGSASSNNSVPLLLEESIRSPLLEGSNEDGRSPFFEASDEDNRPPLLGASNQDTMDSSRYEPNQEENKFRDGVVPLGWFVDEEGNRHHSPFD